MKKESDFDICVVGLGYIGLPTASVFASFGKLVLGVDISQEVVSIINRGEIHIHEPGLAGLVKNVVDHGKLRVSTTPKSAKAFILAVPTPFKNGTEPEPVPDLSFVEAATRSIACVVDSGNIIILESTSPVGTTSRVKLWLEDEIRKLGRSVDGEIMFAHCPERILPGNMLKEIVANDRVIGGLTPDATKFAKQLYKTFCQGQMFETDARTAELVKLTENAFRDVNIAFANELSLICHRLNINVWELIELANRHPRVNILQPGPGVGGHCIAVDPWFIVNAVPTESRIIKSARIVNDSKPKWVVKQISDHLNNDRNATIAFFGLAFKANIDDLRESPAVRIVDEISKMTSAILVVEPHIDSLPKSLAAKVKLVQIDEALQNASIIVLLVDHEAFKRVRRLDLNGKIVIDTRGLWKK